MEGIELKHVTEEKDLGVIMDQELKFNCQTAASIKKANRMLAIIKNSFAVLNIFTLPLLFKALVRPLLDYVTSSGAHIINWINMPWKRVKGEPQN